MGRFPSSMILLFILSFSVAHAQLSSRAQTPVTTITLRPDQIGVVKTALGITTRITFPEKVAETICGDLYDPESGKGTFVIQNSGSDVFLKPVVSKGMSNLFVKTGEGSNQQVYNLDLLVVRSAAQAHWIVTVVAAAPSPPPAPAAAQPKVAKWSVESGGKSMRKPPEEVKPVSPKPHMATTSAVSDAGAGAAGRVPGGTVGGTRPAEPPNVIRKRGGVLRGEAIRKPEPAYPTLARTAGVSGAVVVEVTIDESGDVVAARALSGSPLLWDAAVSAALGWKFNPTTLSGHPVKVIGTITFNFRL